MLVLTLCCALGVAVICCFCVQNFRLRKTIRALKFKNPTEIDLELATYDQIMAELRKRPIRYLFVIPQFKVDEESIELTSVAVEASGLSPEVAHDVMHTACSIMCSGGGTFEREDE